MQEAVTAEKPHSGLHIALCGHALHEGMLVDGLCPFCVDGAEAHALHERLEREEREERRRRERYPWTA